MLSTLRCLRPNYYTGRITEKKYLRYAISKEIGDIHIEG